MKSLEFTTDLLVTAGVSIVEHHPDRTIQRTPAEPDFWFGNRVLFSDPPTDAKGAMEQFHADLPEAKHVCLGWDVPGLPLKDGQILFEGTGLVVEQGDALTLTGALHRVGPPEGITLRPFGPADWAQSEEIALAGRAASVPLEGYRDYLSKRSATRRDQISAGLGQWFGAFDGDLLVGDMGIIHDKHFIRYQNVQTREGYRRRGMCSALLCYTLDWAQARAPKASPVIVAEAESDAGRLYRRAGFALAQTVVVAYRPPA